jgi:hypothetical protein
MQARVEQGPHDRVREAQQAQCGDVPHTPILAVRAALPDP